MNIALPLFGLLAAVLALAPFGARAAGKPDAAPAPVAPPPKSVFVIDPQVGKDPFFPRSNRPFLGVVARTNETVATPISQFPEEIRVQGVSNARGKILVILNGKSIEKGERIELPIRGQRVGVRCVELTEKAILLEVNGVTKELPLSVGAPPQPPQ